MFGRIGPFELILILAIALVVFGPKKLPELGKSLGQAIGNFRKSTDAVQKEIDHLADPVPAEKAETKPAEAEKAAEKKE